MQAEDALERRIVTVLFADLVGFTTLSEQFDAEDVAAIQDRYFAAVRDTVGRYGGRLEKFIGDAAMAVFGVPRGRDDDAERAVRAGLALVHAVQQLGAGLGLDEDVLRLRVGINSGEAVVAAGGKDEGRVTGDTVNTAARFQTAAPVGGVLIGEATALAVADVAELGEQLHLELKGKAEPTTARVVTGFRPEPSREQAMGDLRAPTVGRDVELAELGGALARTAAGAVERWLVVAPPGVGKSRLLRELAELASGRPEVMLWRSRSKPGSVAPFDAIAELFTAALGDVRERSAIEKRIAELLVAAGTPPNRAAVVADTCATLIWPREIDAAGGRPPSEDREALFAAWLDGLDALAGEAQQVWLIEDIHWAGGDVLAFLDLASERAARAGRLIVVTARPSLLDEHQEWASDDTSAGRRILRLGTLEPTDARGLVRALVGEALPNDLVDRIVARSDGNCLFIEELLRTWVSVGTLVRDESTAGWQLTVSADEIPLPQSVQSIYAAQLDDLPPDARRLARRASVAGRRFPVKALEPLEADNSGLEPLRRRELMTGPTAEPLFGDAFAYRHALLRDAGYASLAKAERARLHARLAAWLEQAAGDRASEVAEQIAGHYAAAAESSPALASEIDVGRDRASVRKLAADWYERAGQSTLALSAHDAARQLFRRAIDLTPDDRQIDLARRWERLGDATAFAADMNAGGAAYERAIELYRAVLSTAKDSDRTAAQSGLAEATASLARVWYEQLRFDDARELSSRTLDELGDVGPVARARLLKARGQSALGASGQSPQAEADLEEALRLAEESDDAVLKLETRQMVTVFRSESGRDEPNLWHDLADEAFRLGQTRMGVAASINAAMSGLDDAPRTITEPLERAREVSIAHGHTEDVGWIDYLEAEEAFVAGNWDRALELGRAAIDRGEANAYLRLTVRTIHVVVPIASARGDRPVLERAARWYKSLEGKFEFPDSPYSRVIRTAQDLELASNGLWTPIVPDVEPRIASFADATSGPSFSAAMDRVMRTWIEAGELDGADRALDALAEGIVKSTPVSKLTSGTYLLMRARVAAGRDDAPAAIDFGNQALAELRTSDAPWWIAKAIRLMERAGGADYQLVTEASNIERRLGAIQPTQ